jgi:hypothetical protein
MARCAALHVYAGLVTTRERRLASKHVYCSSFSQQVQPCFLQLGQGHSFSSSSNSRTQVVLRSSSECLQALLLHAWSTYAGGSMWFTIPLASDSEGIASAAARTGMSRHATLPDQLGQ